MTKEEKIKKLETLPWQALYEFAVDRKIDEASIKNKDKRVIIGKILSLPNLADDTIEKLVNDYIYGNRITFTLWGFTEPLDEETYKIVHELEKYREGFLDVAGFRNLHIRTVEESSDRIEVIYDYSKQYSYVNEDGHNDRVWEQHRGCLWLGTKRSYLACISKHDKMTSCIIEFISEKINRTITQIKPPKTAMEKCIQRKAISRIVLQGTSGEKTIISNTQGLTDEQENEMDRVSANRFIPAGSYIADLNEDISATIKYNLNQGTIGIYKHLPVDILFAWTENAINIILDEVQRLKGRPAKEIYEEMGIELKWSGLTYKEEKQFEWLLTMTIKILRDYKAFNIELPDYVEDILWNKDYFYQVPRIYCKECDSDEIPFCSSCGEQLKLGNDRKLTCTCGAPVDALCGEGHYADHINTWFIPKDGLIKKLNKQIKKIFRDELLTYRFCIMGRTLYMEYSTTDGYKVEIPFRDISCFDIEKQSPNTPKVILEYSLRLKEKCNGDCSKEKITQCVNDNSMVCLPKLFYKIIPEYRPQPHKNGEYGDFSGEVQVGAHNYRMKGIIKKNSANKRSNDTQKMLNTTLTASILEGREIIQQFVDQGMSDSRCNMIAVVAPQYFDSNLKGTLIYLAHLAKKRVVFIQLDEICDIVQHHKSLKDNVC